MNQEQLEAKAYLENEMPKTLDDLNNEVSPLWGILTPHHLMEHLIVTYKMSIGRIKIPQIAKDEDVPRLKAYLMKDSPMRRNVPSPTGKNELQPLRTESFEVAKGKFLKETSSFISFMEENPDAVAIHPYGGPMTALEWLLFHRKHIKHHFIQFRLIPDYEQ